jgi:hypothetical protein
MKIMSAVNEKTADWESDVTGATHGIQVTALVKFEVMGESDFYQWVVLVPFEGAENGWTCTMVLVSPAPVSPSAELEKPVKDVGDARVSVATLPAPLALVSRSDPLKIAEAYVADLLVAFKKGDLDKLYTADCVFGNPDAGEPAEQKDVLMMGMKSVGLDHLSKAEREEIKAMKIVSAVTGVVDAKIPVRVVALVKVEVGTCHYKGTCHEGAFYQWVTLVPSANGYASAAVLVAPTPASPSAELLEQPVQAVGDASVPGAAMPAALALLASFASGLLVSGCFLGRKEVFARIMAPTALQEPLLC